jgi:hypothetical protein
VTVAAGDVGGGHDGSFSLMVGTHYRTAARGAEDFRASLC